MGFWSWLSPKKNLEINSATSFEDSNPAPEAASVSPLSALTQSVVPAPAQVVDLDLFMEDFRYIVKSYFDSHNPALFYAKLCGYRHDVTGEDGYYGFMMSSPDSITQQGIAFAIDRMKSEFEYMYFDHWENTFKDYCCRVLPAKTVVEMEAILGRYTKLEFLGAFEQCRSECASFAVNLVNSRRDIDEGNIKYKVEEKWAYLKPLLRNAMLAGVDKYGEQDYKPFHEECREFCEKFFSDEALKFYHSSTVWLKMSDIAFDALHEEPVGSARDTPVDGVEFEIWCAERFIELGWDAQLTAATGDQGVDVVVRKDNFTIAVQCKRYSQPVGNKAVQEAYSGKQYIGADMACVIATAGFTKSAKELARSTLVYLVEAEDIELFVEHVLKGIEA